MENYGTDKPDLRFGSPIIDLTEAMRHSALESFASKVPLEECVMKLVTITAAEDEGDDLPSISQVGSFADKLDFFEGLRFCKSSLNNPKNKVGRFSDSEF